VEIRWLAIDFDTVGAQRPSRGAFEEAPEGWRLALEFVDATGEPVTVHFHGAAYSAWRGAAELEDWLQDGLCELLDSPWLPGLVTLGALPDATGLRHLQVHFPTHGVLDVACEGFERIRDDG
jgi:hypothetical protein